MSTKPASAAPTEDPANKQLRIHLGICRRMLKEVASYEKEVVTNEARVQKMRDDGKDPYDIRKQEEVLQESHMMIPDSKSRLEKVIMELITIMNDVSGNERVDAALISEANEIIAQNDASQGASAYGVDTADDDEPL